ncbi:MAG TPA: hypothetical protein VL588_02935, partial [Bdellovibrionota bacterium]|nr:hypothetical protein [Bdellovibrionota bacterium]
DLGMANGSMGAQGASIDVAPDGGALAMVAGASADEIRTKPLDRSNGHTTGSVQTGLTGLTSGSFGQLIYSLDGKFGYVANMADRRINRFSVGSDTTWTHLGFTATTRTVPVSMALVRVPFPR